MLKIEFTSLNLFHLIEYSLKELLPFYINNIYISENKFINIITNKKHILINTAKNNSYMYISEKIYKKHNFGFNSVLSNLIKRKEIILIEQINFDRIVRFQTNYNIRFYIELIPGRFNFIITDNNDTIINLYSYIKNKEGDIKFNIGDKYLLPNKKNGINYLNKLEKEYLEKEKLSFEDLIKERTFYIIKEKNMYRILPFEKKNALFQSKNISDLIIFAQNDYKNTINNIIKFDKIRDLEKKIQKIQKQLNNIKSEELLQKEINELIEKGDTLKVYINEIQNKDSIEVPSVYSNEKILKIELNKKLSPSQNIEYIFNEVKKLKKKINDNRIKKEKLTNQINELKNKIQEIKNSEIVYTEKKKKKQEKRIGREFTSPNGFRIICGRNAKENDYITTKLASKNDIFFHAREQKGSHVILITNNKQPQKEDMEFAASIAAYYSAGKHSNLVEVQYTPVKYVVKRRKSKSGEVNLLREKVLFIKPKIDH